MAFEITYGLTFSDIAGQSGNHDRVIPAQMPDHIEGANIPA